MKSFFFAAIFGLLATAAQALPTDVKVLAKFDIGYAKCEARFPDMRGHGDEAYLALWRIKLSDKHTAELATVRKSNKYRKERQLALKTMGASAQDGKASDATAEEQLSRQCQATWGETQRNRAPAKK